MNPVIHVEHLNLTYSEHVHALNDVNFDLYAGDLLAIIGPNGAGKSTLMKSIMGLIQPSRSSLIQIEGDRQRVGYVPQHDDVDWSFPVTVEDVVMMGLARQIGWFKWPRKTHHERVHRALERVSMADLATRQIGNLSGGQRRRMFIARAIAQEADILLLDEPFAGVDVTAQSDLMDVIDGLNCDGLTIMLSTHDLTLAFQRFKRVMALNQRLIAIGSPADVYQPDVLSALYGGAVATWPAGDNVMLFVDEHNHCGDGHTH